MVTNAEAALLGLLIEGPTYPYQIEKEVECRDMRRWTDLSMSSIYKLMSKLESKGYVQSKSEISPDNRTRKVISLTEEGRDCLTKHLAFILNEPEKLKYQIDIGINYLHALPKKDAILCLKEYREKLIDQIDSCHALELFLCKINCPAYRREIARRPIYLHEAEIKWVEGFIAQLEKEVSSDDPK